MILLLLTPDRGTDTDTKLRAPGDGIHIEAADSSADPDPEMVFMLCGIAARSYPDGRLDPEIDFYAYEHGASATCKECKATWVPPG